MFRNRVLTKMLGPKRDEVMGNGEDYITRILMTCAHQILSGDQVKKSEIGGACGTHGGQERCVQGFCWETR